MEPMEALARGEAQFEQILRQVRAEQWTDPTSCGDWTVHDLVDHVVGGNDMAALLMAGGDSDAALKALYGTDVGTDALGAYSSSTAAQRSAFAAEDAAERVCHHPIGDVSGADLLGFRVTDLTLHAWDLARAIGADDTLDVDLVELIWSRVEPILPVLVDTGLFGDGPSGAVGDDAPTQLRLLDATGRRP